MKSFGSSGFSLHADPNLFHLVDGGLGAVGANPLETLPRLIMTTLFGKPSCALRKSQHAETEKSRGYDLKADWDLPLRGLVRRDAFRDSVINEVGYEDTLPIINISAQQNEGYDPVNVRK